MKPGGNNPKGTARDLCRIFSDGNVRHFDFFLVVVTLTAIARFHKTDKKSHPWPSPSRFPTGRCLHFRIAGGPLRRRLPLMIDLVFYSVVEGC